MANAPELNPNQIDTIVRTLTTLLDPWLIILYGSYAKGRMRADSDVDIAVLAEREIEDYDLYRIAQELGERIGITIDCVDLFTANTVLQSQILGLGKVLYCGDETRRKYYVIRVFKEYALLNEERAPILKKIKERGTIYGR